MHIVLDDGCDEHRKKVQSAFEQNKLDDELLLKHLSTLAPLMTSIAFGGKKLDTLYLGSGLGTTIPYIKFPIKGQKPLWWDFI